MTNPSVIQPNKYRRVAVLVGLVLAFFVASNLDIAGGQNGSVGVFVPPFSISPTSSDSSTWYCSTPSLGANTASVLTLELTNNSGHRQSAQIEFDQANGTVKMLHRVLAPKTNIAIPVTARATGGLGIGVDFSGGGDLAGLTVSGSLGYSQEFCQPSPGPTWLVQGLGTAGTSAGKISIYNPFGTDSIIDLSFLTPNGLEQPGPLQAMVLGPKRSMSVNVMDWVQGQSPLSAVIQTRLGRVVPGGLELRSNPLPSGITFAPTSPETFPIYKFPLLNQTTNQSVDLDLYNFSQNRQIISISTQSLVQNLVPGTAIPSTFSSPTSSVGSKSSFVETVPGETAISIPLKTIASVPVGTPFSLLVKGGAQFSAIVTLSGSTAGPDVGLTLEQGSEQEWPRWFSVLYTQPAGTDYKSVMIAYGAQKDGVSGLFLRDRLGAANLAETPNSITTPGYSNGSPTVDGQNGVSLSTSRKRLSVYATLSSGTLPIAYSLTASSDAVVAVAFVGSDGSIVPFSSIPMD